MGSRCFRRFKVNRKLSPVIPGVDPGDYPVPPGDGGGEAAELVFWCHRYNGAVPDLSGLMVAVHKGMIPAGFIGNSSYSWGSAYETAFLAWQTANGNPTMMLVRSFWGQTDGEDKAWDVSGSWDRYIARPVADSSCVINAIDVEPPPGLMRLLNTRSGSTLGISGTAGEIADAQAFVASYGDYQFQFPERRNITPYCVPTTPGSLYYELGLGLRGMNEASYSPGMPAPLVGIQSTHVMGFRVATDGHSGCYTPEQAKSAYPGWDRFYFPVVSAATGLLTGAAYYTALNIEMAEILDRL